MKKIVLAILSLSLLYTHPVYTQEHSTPETLFLKAHIDTGMVKLRWAPSTKYSWKDGLVNGYRLSRKTVMRKGQVLEHPEVITLGVKILPAPITLWEKEVHKDPMSAVVAQAIFGSAFQTTGKSGSNSLTEIVMESDELSRRYTFALFACDMSYAAALNSGLAYTDHKVSPGDAYIYEISLLDPEGAVNSTATVYMGANKYSQLPKPGTPVAVASDTVISVSWDYKELAGEYTTYQVERSVNGKTYQVINDLPITSLNSNTAGTVTYNDLPGEYRKFWYRVRGRDIFGNTGPPSQPYIIENSPAFTTDIRITNYEISDDGSVILTWQVYPENPTPLNRFQLLRANKPNSKFTTVTDSIPANTREYEFLQTTDVTYYRLRVFDEHDRFKESSTFMVQVADTTPPGPPGNLQALRSDNEVINLSWEAVPDADLLGYEIFFSPSAAGSFSRLNKKPVTVTSYDYTLKERSSLGKARFMIRSVDRRYNISKSSDTVVLNFAPPPIPPLFTNYQFTDEEGLLLEWTNTLNEEFLSYQLYRQDSGIDSAENWELLKVIDTPEASTYKDRTVRSGEMYRYLITTKNIGKIESVPSEIITIKIPLLKRSSENAGFRLTANREDRAIFIEWALKAEPPAEIMLYRRTGKEKFSLYRTFPGDRKNFTDTEISPNNNYGYMVIAMFNNGERMSLKEREIKF